ncbi:single-stranded DNA-binding protein [Carboxydothermus pertinax]|uniref:Single-stranded DNA-binding protein n=1 Tax=Carboxydothermus pertinax TaxID=870242 RepID=A0A1L8CRN7_9THEO|nr:single-stranded DNA-binding protein [Carboxydothermus pertinax]GAV21586.1 single-strand-binding protein [Carboxydothermus pertinax]
MFNKIILVGRLTRDPELWHTPQGTPVATITIATDRPYTSKEGEREADFVDVVVWNKLAEIVNEFGQKGRLVLIEGRLQIRSYEKEGQKRRVYEVVASNVKFLDKPKRKEELAVEDMLDGAVEIEISDEDLPF